MSPLLLRRLSDEQLGSRLASGQAAAFDELYRRYVHRLAAYGANLLGDGASGDDVAQSALLKAYGALRGGRLPDRVKPWLYRIAHNTAIDLVARRRELPFAELPEGATGSGEPVESSGALVAALASLPERQRRVYVLRELHGLRIDETAAELGLSSSQVEQTLFVARNRMAEHLVFGDRLNCVAVQRLAIGPLDADERRALKTHLRSCSGCRATLGLRGRALGLLPAASFDWLRGLFAGLATGGAPAAAKVGAIVVTATFAAGVSGATDQASHHARPVITQAAAPVTHRRGPVSPGATAPAGTPAPSTSPLVFSPATAVSRTQPVDHHHGSRSERRSQLPGPAEIQHRGGSDGGSGTGSSGRPQTSDGGGGSGDSGSGSDGGHTTVAPVSAPASATSGDGGGDQPSAATVTAGDRLTTTTTDSGGSPDSGGNGGDSGSGSGSGSGDGSGDGHDGSSGDGSAPSPN